MGPAGLCEQEASFRLDTAGTIANIIQASVIQNLSDVHFR
jgi:hypothetical protein